jgi:glyoxylase-like metal-dependent hydrolase (beta-lactamase superfamily II)
MTGAKLVGIAAPDAFHQDQTFKPDRTISDGDQLTVDGKVIEAIHTPGHASNHVCYRHAELDWVFTGDHVIDGSTVVINPPDGNMTHYIESLQKLNVLQCAALAPGHGEIINDPERVITWIIEHRLEREAKVLAALRANPNLKAIELVPHVYKDVDKKLYGWAERSLLAHLLKLADDGVAFTAAERWTAP